MIFFLPRGGPPVPPPPPNWNLQSFSISLSLLFLPQSILPFDGITRGNAATEKSRQLARETHESGPETILTTAEMPEKTDMQPMENSLT